MNLAPMAVAGLLRGSVDEPALRAQLEEARLRLPEGRVDLALVFVSPQVLPRISEILEIVQVHGRARLLAGCSGSGVIANAEEVEEGPALSFLLLQLPGAQLHPIRIPPAQLGSESEAAWPALTRISPEACRGWLAFADPYSFDTETWLEQWNEAYPNVPTIGGLAAGPPETSMSHLFLNQEIYSDGALVIALTGSISLESVVSQGCRPIGRAWTVTSADRNLIQRIGNLPALNVLQDTFEGLSSGDKSRAGGNIFVGLAMNEYQEEHVRGDFLVRNLLAADPKTGVVAVGAHVRVGQTLQFQFRDGASAAEDFSTLLDQAAIRLADRRVLAACLFSCTGRGARLFGSPNQDALRLHQHPGLGAALPVTGFFCNGEIGPVGQRSYLHGYTASAALFVSDAASAVTKP